MQKTARKIEGCMIKHLFDYRPEFDAVVIVCDYDSCLGFRFSDCCRKDSQQDESLVNQSEAKADIIDDCHLDENEKERGHQLYEFVEVPSFVSVTSFDSCEQMYKINITEKGEVNEELKNHYGHQIALGGALKPERSRNISRKNFSLIGGDVSCEPEQIFKVFIDTESDLSMGKDAYLALVARSS